MRRPSPLVVLVALTLVYALGVFPLCYFRHDDWLNINSGLKHLSVHWTALFRPTAFFGDLEATWFFRPFFKGINVLFLKLFHFNAYWWFVAQLFFFVAALWVGFRVVAERRSAAHGALFVAMAAGSAHFHFGSLAWLGEGLMNLPVLLLTLVATWCFCKAVRSHPLWHVPALLSLSVGLGFKEATFFHVLFLGAFALHEMTEFTLLQRVRHLVPYGVLTVAFAVFRLGVLPFNPHYIPSYTVRSIFVSLGVLSVALGLPILALVAGRLRPKGGWAYIPFFLVSVLPYIGQQFFSPGWLTLPGIYLLLFLCLRLPSVDRWAVVGINLALSLGLVLWRVYDIRWYQWAKPQREFFAWVQRVDTSRTDTILIEDCSVRSSRPDLSFPRVVMSFWGLQAALSIIDKASIHTDARSCGSDPQIGDRVQVVRWEFPKITYLSSNADSPSASLP